MITDDSSCSENNMEMFPRLRYVWCYFVEHNNNTVYITKIIGVWSWVARDFSNYDVAPNHQNGFDFGGLNRAWIS